MIDGKPDFEHDIRAGRLIPGMTFHQKVWALTARIPAGTVVTYGDIANALGNPRSCRAVGGALGRNPYAPGVPCHRVVGSDGTLTGFAGGVPKKHAMLTGEGIVIAGGRVDMNCRHFLSPTTR